MSVARDMEVSFVSQDERMAMLRLGMYMQGHLKSVSHIIIDYTPSCIKFMQRHHRCSGIFCEEA